ncbi:MAG TPA: trypsin-like peptidase domain-containing protein [Anaerolineales bacterium]|nr:trypsin-like peptidase domain-containing protein [Anaerolineales bacterium]HNQ94970.1 trypsin-like peptidase domain-containing protein [Anaerolineales bacterium]HNS61707.1 trypsin-like peptidase domain-containing protein [Anaerolineales bacterium]
MKRPLFAFLILTLAAMACQLPGISPLPQAAPDSPAPAASTLVPVSANPIPLDGSLASLYQQVIPGVVAIRTATGMGSGFVFDSEGHIITNQHVIDGVTTAEIAFSSGYKAIGAVIGFDVDADIAVIKVNAPSEEIHPLPIGDSNALLVGQPVVAIGNPFGLNGTMTMGIVSGLGRTQPAHAAPDGGFFSTADIIQTDAAINPGNSGGPLFNLNGEVVGVNQSIRTENIDTATGNAVNSGVAFAISINLVKRVAPVLIRDGKFEYPYLGISSNSDLGLDEVEALGLPQFTGAYVVGVVAGGPADQAGIRAGESPTNIPGLNAGGDLIIALDGNPVITFDDLLSYLITNKSPGDTIILTVLRDGKSVDVPVVLGTRP